jgi:hypothetical protein
MYKKFLYIVGTTKDKTPRRLFKLFQLALLAIFVVFIINLFSIGKSSFGEWGDFFGGVLNPILTFLTFMGLLITIILQQIELKQSRKEFQGQKEALENQEFDNKFFQMVNLLNTIISNLEVDSINRGKKVFPYLLEKLVETTKLPQTTEHTLKNFKLTFKKFNNTYDENFKYYFLNLYQVLKYIDKNSTKKYPLKEYANIVRAQLSKNELILLFFNAIGVKEFSGDNYKKIIEKYSLFEHLTYEDLTRYDQEHKENCMYQIKALVDLILPLYDKNAFGNNQTLLNKLDELNRDNKAEEPISNPHAGN